MPVGRIEYCHLGPLQFDDFLAAAGHPELVEYLQNFSLDDIRNASMLRAVHDKCTDLLKQFWIVGGLPEAVSRYVATGDFAEALKVQHSIVATYRDDFNKYSHGNAKRLVQMVFDQLPVMVGRKFKYAQISRDHRAAELDAALQLNVLALGMINDGALAEQFIGQQLLHCGACYESPALYYWLREARSAAAELDYLIAQGPQVIPVEIKSGTTGTLKSLHQFLSEKQCDFALRINADLPSLLQDSKKLTDGTDVHYTLLSLPLYLANQAQRLIRASIE